MNFDKTTKVHISNVICQIMIHFRKINEKIKKYENMKIYLNMVKHDQEMTKITKK